MKKKTLIIVGTVLAFFAGQIFLESALAAAGITTKTFAEFLVPVFELAVGWGLGFTFKKVEDEKNFTSLKEALATCESELTKLRAKTSKKKTKVS